MRTGRPRLSEVKKRSKKVSVSFTPEEKSRLEEMSRKNGASLSDFLRNAALLHKQSLDVVTPSSPPELISALADIASILMRIYQKTGEVSGGVEVKNTQDILIKIYRLIESLTVDYWSGRDDP